jgi:hypothetical protein
VDWNDEFGVAGKTFAHPDSRRHGIQWHVRGGGHRVPPGISDDAAECRRRADVDNDGYGDLLIGASDNNSGRRMAGAAYLILSPFDGTKSDEIELADADVKFVGEAREIAQAPRSRVPETSTRRVRRHPDRGVPQQ